MSQSISVALKAHLALPSQTTRTIIRLTRKDGAVYAFTDHDQSISYGGYTFIPGYDRSNVAGAADLSVDNLQQQGAIDSSQVTEEDLRIGKWDYARFFMAQINYADTSMGVRIIKTGWLGEVSLTRNQYSAQLNGLTKAYARTIGELTGALCRADLYDARCGVSASGSSTGSPALPLTVTGTVDSAASDGITIYDSARTEPGPAGGIAITGITRANPGVVTMASAPDPAFTDQEVVNISGVVGMTEVNVQTRINSPSGTTFQLSVDTSSFTAYVSGGLVTPLGGDSGFFQYGLITFGPGDSGGGLNNGLSMEIQYSSPGVFILSLPMPYTINPGDTYTMKAGCDKYLTTCGQKFNNILNYRGEWYLTGNDKLLDVGKQH